MLYFVYNLGDIRGKIMKNIELTELEEREIKAQKKFNAADAAIDAGLIVFGMTAGMAAIATLIGGTAAVVADTTMAYTAQGIYENDAFQASIREREQQLTDNWLSGKIDYNEYKAGLNKLYSVEEVISYSKTAEDKKLTGIVESYIESKDLQKTMFTKAVPTFATPAVAGLATALVAGKARKKYQDEVVAIQDEMAAEMAD